MKALNIDSEINKIYPNLKVIEYMGRIGNHHYVLTQCLCKNKTIEMRRLSDIKSYGVKKCSVCRGKHNLHGTRLYSIWKNIKSRCFNSKHQQYNNYGGRGIIMCDEWKNNFRIFYDWAVNNGYSDNLTIDRTNNNVGYYPFNCQWITKSHNTTKGNLSRKYNHKKRIKATSPNNEEIILDNVTKFCNNYTIFDRSAIYKTCNGIYKTHKNWKFEYID